MSATAAKGADKEEVAKLIASWATNELGFRKRSTLVTAKGEETIQPENLEPLLQGRLANILELVATHVVSSQNASYTRRRLAEYCDRLGPGEDGPPDLEYIPLFTSVKQMRAKEQRLLSDIDGMHRQNSKAIHQITKLEIKKTAAERRIRELRLQILVKQSMAENLRRMGSRVKALTKEMMPNSSLVQPSGIYPDVVRSVMSASAMDRGAHHSPLEFLTALTTKAKEAASVCLEETQLTRDKTQDSDDLYKERQLMVAGIITCLKERVNSKKVDLVEKVDRVAGQISMSAEPGDGASLPDIADLRNAIFQISIQSAASHINERLGSLVPDLVSQSRSVWSQSNGGEKTDQITQTVARIQTLLADIKQSAADVERLVLSAVSTESKRFVNSLFYADPREAWNAVDIWRLQNLTIDPSDQAKGVAKPADKLVTRNNLVEVDRFEKVTSIFSHIPDTSGQAHELAVANIAEHLIQGLRQVHVMANVRASLSESKVRMAQHILSEESLAKQGTDSTLEDTLESVCAESKEIRSSARAAIKSWAEGSSAEDILQLVVESEATEERVAHLSETSGKLFTDSFAPWHKRDGVSYAEYLKQLRIARTSDGR
ncbi:hypothetical protein EV175_004602 [Coemansia sp. RSA 1933]|nr:hypothetical protein EV175_004602 [Coemansia sp. RSA 1933]